MRLGQLARKLSVRPSQLVDLLAKDQLYFEEGSNAKLNDELVKRLVLQVAPDKLAEIMTVQKQDAEPEPQPHPVPLEDVVEEKAELQPEPLVASSTEVSIDENVETIRAPKVELAGLKVLGKIELPAPRKKEEPKVDGEDVSEAEQKPKRERKDKPTKPVERDRQWRNPIAMQREKEQREKDEKRKQALEQEKERKRLNYLNRVKTSQPTKAARIYDEAEESEPQSTPEQKPRTWFGKFLKWLNT